MNVRFRGESATATTVQQRRRHVLPQRVISWPLGRQAGLTKLGVRRTPTTTNDTLSEIDRRSSRLFTPMHFTPTHISLCLSGDQLRRHGSLRALRVFHWSRFDSISGERAAPGFQQGP